MVWRSRWVPWLLGFMALLAVAAALTGTWITFTALVLMIGGYLYEGRRAARR